MSRPPNSAAARRMRAPAYRRSRRRTRHCDGPAGQEHHADGHRYPTDGTARRDAKHEPHMQMEAHHYCRQVKSPVLGHGPSSVSRSEK